MASPYPCPWINSWSLTLPTRFCLYFQPHDVPFAPLLPVLQPCRFSFISYLRTFAQAINSLTEILFLSTLHLTSFRFHLTYAFLRNVFQDSTDYTLGFSCVTFVIHVLTWLISLFLGRLYAPWEQGPCLALSLPSTQGLLSKCLLNAV